MLDFKELGKDGTDFELMTRELLFSKGYRVVWSGQGPDGGKDLICEEEISGDFAPFKRRWLVQCKHNAHSGNAVGLVGLGNIIESCVQHKANGYLLVCSTYPSSAVVERLEEIHENEAFPIATAFWDSSKLERELLSTSHLNIANRYMPISSGTSDWKVFHTEWPNRWIVTYKSHYFHIAKRIGSNNEIFLESIDSLLTDVETIDLEAGHCMRLRAAYYDDKHGVYTCYLDYMYPHGERPIYNLDFMKKILGDESVREDGQMYSFDIIPIPYFPQSDHHDFDHYDYYTPYVQNFNIGSERKIQYDKMPDGIPEWLADDLDEENETIRHDSFNNFVEKLKLVPSVSVRTSVNCNIEDIDIFHKRFNLAQMLEEREIKLDRFFSAKIFLYAEQFEPIKKLLETFPQRIEESFRLTQVHIFLPNDDMTAAEYNPEETGAFYELLVTIHPYTISNKYDARKRLNTYFDELSQKIDEFV